MNYFKGHISELKQLETLLFSRAVGLSHERSMGFTPQLSGASISPQLFGINFSSQRPETSRCLPAGQPSALKC